MDRYLANAQALIDEHGWLVQTIMGRALVAYTVGLQATYARPELVITGLDQATGQHVLNVLAKRLSQGELELDETKQVDNVFEGFSARLRPVAPAEAGLLRIATLFSPGQKVPPVGQVLWPDPNGHFPGDLDAQEQFVAMQNIALMLEEPAEEGGH
jgi:hypothetical protein